jgi:hypothetical protein
MDDAPSAERGAASAAEPSGDDTQTCPVTFCPIGLALSAAQRSPDAVEHLIAAGREFLLAARAVLDARRDGSEDAAKLERIEID